MGTLVPVSYGGEGWTMYCRNTKCPRKPVAAEDLERVMKKRTYQQFSLCFESPNEFDERAHERAIVQVEKLEFDIEWNER